MNNMALVSIPNNQGIWMKSTTSTWGQGFIVGGTMSATGNVRASIGKIMIQGGTGSKTISAAGGGKIVWSTSSVATFVNAGTTLRIGLQDVDSSGNNDGTYDVYADLVGGTDTLATNTRYITAMESGTKTLSNGDLISIVFTMVSRGGSDQVNYLRSQIGDIGLSAGASIYPYDIVNTTKQSSSNGACGMIIFDDGSFGTIEGVPFFSSVSIGNDLITYAQNSTPDEYASVFKVPFKCAIKGCCVTVASIGTSDNFDVILYSDPEGTPSAIQTVSINPVLSGSTTTGGTYKVQFDEVNLDIDTWYAIAVRPTTNNSISIIYQNLQTGNSSFKTLSEFGTDIKFSARTNQTGAFSEVQTYYMPVFGILLSKLDNGDTFTPQVISV